MSDAVILRQPHTALMPTNLREAMELATTMSKAKLLPAALQNSPGDTLLVIEQAMRWGMSPFAAAQEVSVISGKLMFSGKIVAAAIQSSGVLAGRLRYAYAGEGEERAITVSGKLLGEQEPRTVTVAWKDAKTQNQMWVKQPDQQLAYHGARVWARRHAPEVMLGIYTPEEMPAHEEFAGVTLDAEPKPEPPPAPKSERPKPDFVRYRRGAEPPKSTLPFKGDPKPEPEPTHVGDVVEYPFATKNGGKKFSTGTDWLGQWRKLIDACKQRGELDRLQTAVDMNRSAIAAVRQFDPLAAGEVLSSLAQALSALPSREEMARTENGDDAE